MRQRYAEPAAAPCAAVMPGTTSTAMPAARQAAISSPARPKISGSPPLSRTTRRPLLASVDHQRVDVVLLAGGAVAGLADQHLLGLAAREFEHVTDDQIVEQDHVGRLQRAHRAQRQQLRIARPGADQGHRAGLGRRAPALRVSASKSSKSAVRRCLFGLRQRVRGEQLPEAPARRERKAGGLDRVAPAPRRFRPGGKAARDQRLELRADRLAEHRRGAVGRNADHQRRAIDDRAEGEVAEFRLVDDVDRHAGSARGLREARGIGVVCQSRRSRSRRRRDRPAARRAR